MISLGINHVEPVYLLGPYNREATLKRYGDDFVTEDGESAYVDNYPPNIDNIRDFNPCGRAAKRWMSQVLRDLAHWGINTLGRHTSLPRELLTKKIYHVQALRSHAIEPYAAKYLQRPDVFSDQFASNVENAARSVCMDCINDSNLLGYAFNDVPEWHTPIHYVFHPWCDALRSLGSDALGKRKWVEVLERRYSNAKSAARTYGVKALVWDDFLDVSEWPALKWRYKAAAVGDSQAFLSRIAEQWYESHVEAVRRYDNNHLILGDKLAAAPLPDFMLPILRKYVDVVYLQWYSRFEEQESKLHKIYEETGKPILLGDSAFSVVQPQQEAAKGFHVRTQREVGQEYFRYLKNIMSLPFVIGWHYCGYIEGWKGLDDYWAERQCGFKDPFENVHDDAIVLVRKANLEAHKWHKESKGKLRESSKERSRPFVQS